MVAHRAGAGRPAAGHHLRQPRHRPVRVHAPQLHRSRRWPTTRRRCSTALGLDSAHVYGISLGGMVAQKLVLRHPERVRGLVLGATQAGGPRADPARSRRARLLQPPRGHGDGGGRVGLRAVQLRPALPRGADRPHRGGHRAAPREPVQAGRRTARSSSPPPCTTCYGRLPRIKAPTLVVHGEHDRVIPVENARLMAERIPGCRLQVLLEVGPPVPDRGTRGRRGHRRVLR